MATYDQPAPEPLTVYSINRYGAQFIHAEDLYIVLNKTSEPNEWLSINIDQYGFTEDVDFVLEGEDLSIEHTVLTMDMAKNLANTEQTERGIQIRRELAELSALPKPSNQGPLNPKGMSADTEPVSENKVVVDFMDIANLIQGIRCYQYAFNEVQKSLKVDWINNTIESIKNATGKHFCDD